MASSLAILSSMGGWVLKSLSNPPPERGFTMNIWDVAGFASIGIFCDAAFSLRSALERYRAFPASLAPPSSARYSLDLDMAIWTIRAAIGPTIIITRAAIGF